MFDILAELEAIHREVTAADDGEIVRVVVERSYPTTPDDLWEAITDPDRVRRWFMPITGDLRAGGRSSSKATPAATSWPANRRHGYA